MSSTKLTKTVKPFPGGCVVRVEGTIDADLKDTGLLDDVTGFVVLDLDGVKRITSFGVREWITTISRVAPGHLFFVNCRPSVVSQFNMVARFGGPGELVSLYLPYVCASCDHEFETLLDLRTDHALVRGADVPSTKCPQCGADGAEFDDAPASYFAYVAQRAAPVVPDVVRAFLDGGSDPGAKDAVLHVQKEVADDVTGIWLSGALNLRARFKRAGDGLEGDVVLICAGVDRMDPAGAEKLSSFIAPFVPGGVAEGASLWLARVRPALLAALDKGTVQSLQHRVAELLIHADCPRCGDRGEVVVDMSFASADGPPAPRPCFRCGGDATPVLSDAQRAGLRVLLGDPPASVRAYLDKRPGAQPLDPVTKTGARDGSESGIGPQGGGSKYEVLSRIGQGGMAEVVLARQRGLEGFAKMVVLKRILSAYAAHGEFVRMFLQEARVAARINHPNVVQIFDLGRDGPHYFIAMEYVRGWDLKTVLATAHRAGKPFPVEIALKIVADVCAGLHAAHTCVDPEGKPAPVVHRDVSPHNVLVSVEGAVKLTDFGISKAVDVTGARTRPGTLKGKVTYMAPEQVDETLGRVDVRSDVFAAGIILHELLAGVPLFRRESEYASLMAVLSAPIPSLRDKHDVTPKVDDVVQRALQRVPDDRFQTALEMQLAIEDALSELVTPATASHVARWLAALSPAPTADVAARGVGQTPTGPTSPTGDVGTSSASRDPVDDTIVLPRAENE